MNESRCAVLLDRYLTLRATTLSPSTVTKLRIHINGLLTFLQEHYPRVHTPGQLRRHPHIEQWLHSLLEHQPPLSSGTRRAYVLAARRFLHDIWQWHWTNAPTHLLIQTSDLPRMPRYLPKPLSPSIDARLQQALQARDDLPSQGLLLARWTGLRIGELARLERNALAAEITPCPSLRIPLGKLRNQRVIPVDSATTQLIDRILEQTRTRPPWLDPSHPHPIPLLLCRTDGSPLKIRLLEVRLREVARAAGIQERVYPHRLRHTYATEMLRLGVPIPAVMKLLGHKTVCMTLRYTEVTHQDLTRYYNEAIAKTRTFLPPALTSSTAPATLLQGHQAIPDLFDQLIAAVQHLHRHQSDPLSKSSLQRLLESLRRAKRRVLPHLPADS